MFNLRLALRTLFRTPFVTAVAILSLGLGIGANAAIFSLFNQILLKPLPVPDAGRLVNLAAPGPKSGMNSCGSAGPCSAVFSYPMFRDLEKSQTPFTGIAAHRNFGANLSDKGQSEGGDSLQVSGSYFSVLGLAPAAGRLLASVFAGVATLLAAIGLDGVLAYGVAQRTREIGLRMALGADRSSIRGMVLRQVGTMTLVGGAIGLVLAAAAGWVARSQLYGMSGFDPLVLAASSVLLALVALSAGFVPAFRAARVDPMRALRYE